MYFCIINTAPWKPFLSASVLLLKRAFSGSALCCSPIRVWPPRLSDPHHLSLPGLSAQLAGAGRVGAGSKVCDFMRSRLSLWTLGHITPPLLSWCPAVDGGMELQAHPGICLPKQRKDTAAKTCDHHITTGRQLFKWMRFP